MLIYHSPNPKALKNYTKSALLVFCKYNNKAWMTAYLHYGLEYFKPTVEIYCSEKKVPFKILLFTDNPSGFPGALIERYHEINAVFLPASPTSIL